jgi:hypothetical protein
LTSLRVNNQGIHTFSVKWRFVSIIKINNDYFYWMMQRHTYRKYNFHIIIINQITKKFLGSSRTKLFVFTFTLLSYLFSLNAQTINSEVINQFDTYFKKTIGLDQNLINGYQFIDQHPNSEGHAYFNEDKFLKGRIIVNNIEYTDMFLKYDIYNQRIILKYKYSFGGENQIILHNESISEFEIGEKLFRRLYYPETGIQFFQIVADNDLLYLLQWKKQSDYSPLDSHYKYSDQKKKSYLVINNKFLRFYGNGPFIKLFPKNQQTLIKQYIKKNKIQLNKATDRTIKNLVRFCSDLKEEGNKK